MIKKIIFPLLAICFASCTKYLDKQPDNLLTEEMVWQTKANAEGYLYNTYSHMYLTDGGDFATMGASDESHVSIGTTASRQMVSGNWSPASGYFNNWGSMYAGIRKTFVFEQNIDKVPSNQLSDELKAQYKAEVRFLRGYYYFFLLRQFGPFVLVKDIMSRNDDYNQYPRASFDECAAYINEMMDAAAAGLPVAWESISNNGRPTKGACLTIKAKVAQLAASELWNGNPNFASFKNQDGKPLAPASKNPDRWRDAAAAAKAVIDLNAYKLFVNTDNGGSSFNPYESVRDVHTTAWNDEIILGVITWWRWGFTKCASPQPGGYGMYCATQNLVDAFSMKNGRIISDPASTYQETGFADDNQAESWGHKKGQWNMYANREPRFYAFIQYNGKTVVPATTPDERNRYSSGGNADGTGRIEFYYSGKSGQRENGSNSITGYMPLKRISSTSNIYTELVPHKAPFILFRYAEILLDYVEALNEYDPSNPDIVKYLNEVRTRAGLPGIETVYGGAVGNKDEMRKHILRERMVELCFEGDRYWTLTRRLLLGKAEYSAVYALDVNAPDNGQGFSFTGLYTRKLLQQRYWRDKMYLFPIDQGDMERDRALVQNPGW
ncbi:RagB/SusD family nutrient uptake outer membrane protein [Chitinophaga rhizosphaerae]|uniref:RagB/SusD family nutrient uptake outer membrane protein n=1 Tax=Chitinophaga rhizosphaerae TaxID=1864947 RepID=UPI000F7FD888|nr:RagB/SusD family nutrient uptake outer membrane protein [Chitinophaga rhizosphaerae]